MTVKEIALFTGKNETTVTRWIKKAIMQNAELKMQNAEFGSYGHDYLIDEVEEILKASSMSKDAISILMQNARSSQNLPSKSTSGELSHKLDSFERAFEMMAKAFDNIAETQRIIAATQKSQDERLTKVEKQFEERKALLPPPQISPRQHITQLIRKFVGNTGLFSDAWMELYESYGLRTHTNPILCASNRKMKVIDYLESIGEMETLESVAMEIFK